MLDIDKYLQGRRVAKPDFRSLLDGLSAPKSGPDMAAAPPPQMMQMQPVDFGSSRSPWGDLAGVLAGRAAGALLKKKPVGPPGASMERGLGSAGAAAFDPNTMAMPKFFGHGGTLRRDGDVAIVGDEGPELALKVGGKTHVIPLDLGGVWGDIQKLVGSQAVQAQPADNPQTPPMQLPLSAPRPALSVPDPQAPEGIGLRPGESGLTPPMVRERRVTPDERVGLVGVDVDPATAGAPERPRIVDPRTWAVNRSRDEILNPTTQQTNGRGMSALKTGAATARQVALGGGSPAQILGALLGGSVMGAVQPGSDEVLAEEQATARRMGAVKASDEFERSGLQNDLLGAQVRGANASAAFNEVRPALEESKIDAKRRFDEWRMWSGNRKQDSAESYIEWKKLNGDRRASTDEGRLELAREWNEFRRSDADRNFDQRERFGTRRFEETRRMNDARIEEIGGRVQKIRKELQGVSAADARRFNIDTKGMNERLRAIERDRLKWQRMGAENSVDPMKAAEEVERLDAEAEQLQTQLGEARERAVSGAGSSTPSRQPQYAGQRMSRSKLPAAAKRMGVSEAEAERRLRSEGVTIY
jgi:hypothetical protein